jgi:alpha-L-fucosidase
LSFVLDSFTDAPSNTGTAHVGETGAAWALNSSGDYTGDSVITDANRVRPGTGNPLLYASGTPAGPEYDVEAILVRKSELTGQPAGDGDIYICGRCSTNASTFYGCIIRGINGQVFLYEVVAGSFTQLGSTYVHTWAINTATTFKLELRDASKKVYIDGVEVISDTTHNAITAAGRVAYQANQGSTAPGNSVGTHIDSITATDAVGGGSLVAGTLTTVANSATSITVAYATVIGGTGPYSNHLQRSTTSGSGFANVGSPVAGATATFPADTGRTAGTTYYYRVVTTDSAGSPATVTSAELAVTTWTTLQAAYVALGKGQFIHFGPWSFANAAEVYDPDFDPDDWNPSDLDVDQWLDAGKAMSATYAVLTTKHHGGFCLWPTATTTQSIASSSWYQADPTNRDIVKLFTDKCRGKGITPVLYYSVWDLNWEAAHPGFTAQQYQDFTLDQLTELLSDYGDIAAVWLDGYGWLGSSDGVPYSDLPFATVRALVQSLLADCLTIVNNQESDLSDTELVVYEVPHRGTVPAGNTLPAEAADTIWVDGRWAWFKDETPTALLSAATVIARRDTAIARSAASLFNCSPDETGQLSGDQVSLLREIGGDVTPPADPTGLSAAAGNGQVTLSWTDNAGGDVSGVNLYYSTDNISFTLVDPLVYAYVNPANNPHLGTAVTGLVNGTLYYFKIKARDYSGNLSGFSSTVTATPVAGPAPALAVSVSGGNLCGVGIMTGGNL